ncbi:5-formyltetrahydrofolate cyclo-ligase [Futiania mangrovi]|uniref:5-formyltetrahydrofolate cyclo-ligase n=1 Tax=Futiania mangrovi TaxID=2959716 RepID=A0A9J6P7N0_9PROT|nr:5-formyltetrahydrofolate cyclo-ligase [Futiania mangrovii]MCP1334884.1 5-formyltetrahydrofolate cyclo-ligase [Futiania mangrovii]
MTDRSRVSDDISATKAAARAEAKAARRAAQAAAGPDAGGRAARNWMALAGDVAGRTVAVYYAMGEEMPTLPLIAALVRAGASTALPVVAGRDRPLVFRAWAPGDPLVSGGFGTSVPAADAAVVVPEILAVPLLAWDGQGYRLGYGGGFYDRTLAALRAAAPGVRAIGLAFAGQRVAGVPREATDIALDALAHEAGIVRFGEETA